MTKTYTFKTLYDQIKAQKSDFWRTSFYGIIATLLLLPIPMLIPLLIDEVLLAHPGKMIEMISVFFGSSEVWVYIAVILIVVLTLRFLAFFFNIVSELLFIFMCLVIATFIFRVVRIYFLLKKNNPLQKE